MNMGWEELRQGPLESRCSCFSACTYRVFLVLVRKARVSTACPGLHQRWPRAEAFLSGDFSSVSCARALVLLQSSLLITGASTTSHPSGTFSVHPHCCPHHLPLPNPQRPVHKHLSSHLLFTSTERPSHIPQVHSNGSSP